MNSNYERYGALGFPLFKNNYQPIPVKGKVPIVKEWPTRPITAEAVKGWSEAYQNWHSPNIVDTFHNAI